MSIGQDFATLLRTLASSSMVLADDRHIWEAAADAVPRLKGVSGKVRMVFIHDDFDPAMAVLDDFSCWLDAQRDDIDSAANALDFVRAQLAAVRRHQDALSPVPAALPGRGESGEGVRGSAASLDAPLTESQKEQK